MRCINTSRRLGVSLFRCSAFETTTLNAAQPPPPLGAPSSPHTWEMEGKEFFLRIIGSLEKGATKMSQESGTLDLIYDCCMSTHDMSPTWQPQQVQNTPPDSQGTKWWIYTDNTDNILIFFSSTTKEQPTYCFTSRSSMTSAHYKTQILSWLVTYKKVCD